MFDRKGDGMDNLMRGEEWFQLLREQGMRETESERNAGRGDEHEMT